MPFLMDVNLSLDSALFLDLDGTLADISPDRNSIRIPPAAQRSLMGIFDCLSGAVAIVSGRDIDDLAVRVPEALWRIGNHGAFVLAPGESGRTFPSLIDPAIIDDVKRRCAELGLDLEVKKTSIAIHYRSTPELESASHGLLARYAGQDSEYLMEAGKMVAELKVRNVGKGKAIEERMRQAPFAGRLPLFLGDDVTDEDAYPVINRLGGVSIKVGAPPSLATTFASSPAEVRQWLEQQAAALHTL
ncbi:trehalose-phosphatase [Rhizobium daejeonense]